MPVKSSNNKGVMDAKPNTKACPKPGHFALYPDTLYILIDIDTVLILDLLYHVFSGFKILTRCTGRSTT